VTNGTNIKTTDYLDGFQYNEQVLEFFPTTEGYVKATPTGLVPPGTPPSAYAFNYVFNYTDHLGNVRVSYTKDPQTGNLKILDESHYYPFGLKHQEYSTFGFVSNPIQGVIIAPLINNPYKYKYQGQELQDELGLNWYSFKWRNYMPDIGRFFNVDPLSEDYAEQSPYTFCQNSPVAYMELEGLEGVLAIFYHGGPTGGGLPTTVDKAGYTGQYFSNTQSTAMTNNRDFAGTIIAPGWTSASGVETGLDFVNENYVEGDQIIIYGYSYGVDVAVDLATELNNMGVPVDLLVTVDGSDGPLQNTTVNTTIPENVDTNLNVYQTNNSGASSSSRSTGASSGSTSSSSGSNSSGSSNRSNSGSSNSPGSSGGPNKAANSSKTNVINKNVTAQGTTHGNIQQKSKNIIQREIDTKITNFPTN